MPSKSEITKAKRAEAKKNGMCTVCFVSPAYRDENGKQMSTRCRHHYEELSAYNKARREDALAKGLCETCCKNPVVPGSTRCAKHLRAQNERAKTAYHEALAVGKCPTCPDAYLTAEDIANGRKLCEKCRERAAREHREYAAAKTAAGLCVERGCRRPAEQDRTRCAKHLSRNCKYAKQLSEERKAAGICVNHAEVLAEPGHVMCRECLDKQAMYIREYWKARVAKGLCGYGGCDQPPLPGLASCAKHLKEQRDYRFKLKLEVLAVYGGPVCADCRTDDIDVLDIHHSNFDGAEQRRETGTVGGYSTHLYLKKNGFPSGYEVLCANCHRQRHAEERKTRLAQQTVS